MKTNQIYELERIKVQVWEGPWIPDILLDTEMRKTKLQAMRGNIQIQSI